MTDLLVQRLKAAKRELTALKTAHRRGLGLLKVYDKIVSLEIPQDPSYYYYVEFDITFAQGSSPYPFIELIPKVFSGTAAFTANGGIEYYNGGMACKMVYSWVSSTPSVDTVTFLSTAKISTISQNWRQ